MKIRSEEAAAFRNALDKCVCAVWLITPGGDRINMKTPGGQHEGISRLLKDEYDELELFTCSYEDEVEMMRFFSCRESGRTSTPAFTPAAAGDRNVKRRPAEKRRKYEVYTDRYGELQFRLQQGA